ncbi:hypothetical protein WAI453_007137 [Rhynchosporium graminicola]|uniref:Cupin 2 conserved barrel domain-containing protein n=1 Tax=Rhynchosporium graminicola TaxID=2792576 RepID=A0A1E1LDK4_9HELO|nr:uncharacterized protein RCO7_02273 [Rhynchosporium commune]
MPRTSNIHVNVFTRPGSVTYTLPSPPYSSPCTTITLPVNSTWTSGLHWHETHTEFLQIISGAALITLNNVAQIYTSLDGIVAVPRFSKHEWRRASLAPSLGYDFSPLSASLTQGQIDDEELVVHEWTDPNDGQKEVFFRNLSGIIADGVESKTGEWVMELRLWALFREVDNWPVVLETCRLPILGPVLEKISLGRISEWVVTHAVFGILGCLGWVVATKGVREEYTPKRHEL